MPVPEWNCDDWNSTICGLLARIIAGFLPRYDTALLPESELDGDCQSDALGSAAPLRRSSSSGSVGHQADTEGRKRRDNQLNQLLTLSTRLFRKLGSVSRSKSLSGCEKVLEMVGLPVDTSAVAPSAAAGSDAEEDAAPKIIAHHLTAAMLCACKSMTNLQVMNVMLHDNGASFANEAGYEPVSSTLQAACINVGVDAVYCAVVMIEKLMDKDFVKSCMSEPSRAQLQTQAAVYLRRSVHLGMLTCLRVFDKMRSGAASGSGKRVYLNYCSTTVSSLEY